jgi:lipoate-protein ligase A
LAEVMGEVPPMDHIKEALVQGFSSALNVDIRPGSLSPREKSVAEELVRTKYGDSQHTFRY